MCTCNFLRMFISTNTLMCTFLDIFHALSSRHSGICSKIFFYIFRKCPVISLQLVLLSGSFFSFTFGTPITYIRLSLHIQYESYTLVFYHFLLSVLQPRYLPLTNFLILFLVRCNLLLNSSIEFLMLFHFFDN